MSLTIGFATPTNLWNESFEAKHQILQQLDDASSKETLTIAISSSVAAVEASKEAFTKLELELDGGQEGSQEGSQEGQEDGATCEACQKLESSCEA